MSLEEFLIPGLRQKAPHRGGMWAVARQMWRAMTCMSELWLFQLGLVGERNAAPAEPLLPLFDAVGCTLVGAVVCRDPSELEAVLVVWGCLSFQGISAKAQMGAAPCRQQIQTSMCVSFGPADFFVKGRHHCFFKTTESFHKHHLTGVTIFSSWRRAEDAPNALLKS